MKRILTLLLAAMLLLTACQKVPPAAPPAPPEEKEPAVELPEEKPEQDNKPAQQPEAERPQPSAPETEEDSALMPPLAPKVETDWLAVAEEAYAAITSRETFQVRITEPDGTFTDLTVATGVNDWNVEHAGYSLGAFTWSAASESAWEAQAHDRSMSFFVPGEISLSCTQGSDLVKITTPEKTDYLRAVNPAPDLFLSNLYSLLGTVPEDAYGMSVWSAPTADGALEPAAAAAVLAECVAANYRAVPDWVSWKPLDVRFVSAEVYDVYRGTPEQFCFNLALQVKLEDPLAPEALYWQAGAGLAEPDADGFCDWSRQVLVEKQEDGSWAMLGWGGGYTVEPVKPAEKPQLDWLVELFCLTEGLTHDSVVSYLILELPAEQLARLPELLDQLTEAESRALCLALQEDLLDGHAAYTTESLKELLGDYGAYLGA